MTECPAEIVMERPNLQNDCRWCWAVCQPDAAWGEYKSGSHWDYSAAYADALFALRVVHRLQGYY